MCAVDEVRKRHVLVALAAATLVCGTIGTFRVNLKTTHVPPAVNPFVLAHPLPKSTRQAIGIATRSRVIQQPAVVWPRATEELGRSDVAARRTFFFSSMSSMLLLTVAIGTAALLAGRGLHCLRGDKEKQAADLRNVQKFLCPVAVICHLTVLTGQVLATVHGGRLSTAVGLPWESYYLILACGCAWLLVQAVVLVVVKPGDHYSATAFATAVVPALTPYLADPFDSLKDALLAGLFLAGEGALLNALGCLSLMWLWALHLLMLCDEDLNLELQRAYCSVLKAKPIQAPKDGDAAPKRKTPISSSFKTLLISKVFPQVTEERRRSLLLEDGPQGLLAVAYTVLTGGLNVAVFLSIAIPLTRYMIASIMYPWLLRQPWVSQWFLLQRELACKAGQRSEEEYNLHYFLASIYAMDAARDPNPASKNYEPLGVATEDTLCLNMGVANEFLEDKDLTEVPVNFTHVKAHLENVGLKVALDSAVACCRMPDFKSIQFGKARGFADEREYVKADGILKLYSFDIGPNGAKHVVQALQTLPKVTTIEIDNNGLGPEGARIISEALPSLPELRKIYISENNMGLEGARVMSEVIPQTKLKKLYILGGNGINEEGTRLLKEACEKIECELHLR